MRGAYLAVMFGAAMAGAPAQEAQPQPRPQPQAPPQKQPFLGYRVDGVIKTVNDSAILESNLRTVAAGHINAYIQEHGSISPPERQRIYDQDLLRLVDDYRLAKAAASLGPQSADQIEQIVQSELARSRLAQEREVGVNEMGRELKRKNLTLATIENDKRIDLQKQIAEEMTVFRRLRRQENLYVTPRMLRETFARFRTELFEREAAATIVALRFVGEGAQQRAAEASAVWRKEGIDLHQLAARFPGCIEVGEMDTEGLKPELAKFALAGPEGAISDPVAMPDGFLVARVNQFRTARHARFEDPEVQAQLQRLCEKLVQKEFRDEAMKRATDRTEVWP